MKRTNEGRVAEDVLLHLRQIADALDRGADALGRGDEEEASTWFRLAAHAGTRAVDAMDEVGE
jgi:hypothetical protein